MSQRNAKQKMQDAGRIEKDSEAKLCGCCFKKIEFPEIFCSANCASLFYGFATEKNIMHNI